MSKLPKFGKTTDQTVLDNNGSTLSKEITYKDGQAMKPIRKRYEYRVKVYTKQDELAEFLKYQDDTEGKMDPEFRREYSSLGKKEGFHYIVKCWSELGEV